MPTRCCRVGCGEPVAALLFVGIYPAGYCGQHRDEHRAFEQRYESWREALAEGTARWESL